MLNRYRHSETASAMIAAIALLVLAAFVAVAIVIGAMSSSDNSRRQLESSATEQLARDAGTVIAGAYSSLRSGEQDRFLPSAAVISKYTAELGGGAQVTTNDAAHNDVSPTIPSDASHRYTVRTSLSDGRLGYWQLYAIVQPTWGETKAAVVQMYVRAWTSAANGSAPTRAQIYNVTLRPTWFADYQAIADGKFAFGDGAHLTGRVHSNGAKSSYGNQFATESWAIELDNGVRCDSTVRITTSTGPIDNNSPSQCAYHSRPQVQANVNQHVNILRAREAIETIRGLCGLNGGVRIVCSNTTNDINVKISGNSVSVSGVGTFNAGRTSSQHGLVVVARGHVHVDGSLGTGGRLTIMTAAAAGTTYYGSDGSAPSIWFDGGSGSYGAHAGDNSSSFGAVAEGDIIVDERSDCGGTTTVRGAFIATSGLLSANPRWRGPMYVAGGGVCGNTASIQGSIVGHYGPILYTAGMGGWARRSYTMLPALYNNPPPMYPTISDWQSIHFAPADANCFSATRMPTTSCT